MRHRLVILTLLTLIAGAEYAADVPLTIEKTADCAARVTVLDRVTGDELAKCDADCQRVSVSVPAGTWVRVVTRGSAGCRHGLVSVDGERNLLPRPRIGWVSGGTVFQVGRDGNLVQASFKWSPPRQNLQAPYNTGHVK